MVNFRYDPEVADAEVIPGHQPDSSGRWALEYIVTAYDESRLKKRKEELRRKLVTWITENCDEDDDGNFIWQFGKPLILDNENVSGLMLKKLTTEVVDESKAWDLMVKYNAQDRCMTETLDADQLFAMHSEGYISDEDIESIFDCKESYSLVRMRE